MDKEDFKTGSIFWILFVLIAFTSLFYLGVWGFWNNNLKAVAISSIFAVALTFSLVISKGEVFRLDMNFKNSCLVFVLGSAIGLIISTLSKIYSSGSGFTFALFSSAHMQHSGLFAVISTELPIFWEKFLDNIGVPTVEELIFLIGLPIGILWILNIASESIEWLKSKWLKVFIIVIIVSPLFALFHVGDITMLGFLISAAIFRAVLLTIYWGDEIGDLLPNWKVVPSLMLGWHIGNNVGQDGISNFVIVLQSQWYGWLFLILFVAVFFVAIDKIIELPFMSKKQREADLEGV